MSKKNRRPLPGGSGSSLQKALALHQAGQYGEAEALYRQLPGNDPNVLQLLGVLCFQTGRRTEGKDHLNLALQIDPNHVEALTNLGVAVHEEGDSLEALGFFERALILQPNRPDLLNKEGFILQELDRHSDAILKFEAAIQVQPAFSDAWFNLGHSLVQLKRDHEAEMAYRKVLSFEPSNYKAWSNLGESLYKQHQFEQSIDCYKKSLSIHPTSAAYHNLGQSFNSVGAISGALKATEVSIQLNPKNPIHHAALGELLLSEGRYEEALLSYQQAINFDSKPSKYLLKLAETQFQSGDFEASLETYGDNKSPAVRFLKALTSPIVPRSYAELRDCRERVKHSLAELDISNAISDPLFELTRSPFHLTYQDEPDLSMNLEVARVSVDACPSLVWESPNLATKSSGKIRVGIICSSLNRHSTGRWFLETAAGLADDDIELTFYDTGNRADDWTSILTSRVAKSGRLYSDLEASRNQIAEERFDAIFYPEIGVDPLAYYLSFARLAPFQFTTAGSPWSTGHSNVDVYVSGKDMETDESDSHYSERLFLTNSPLFIFEKGTAALSSRESFGLPENKRIYFCPQPAMKIHPHFDATLNEILDLDPDGVVVFIAGKDRKLAELLNQRFNRFMPDKVNRIFTLGFLSYEKYLGLCSCVDVGLDTHYFGGGNSSLDMLSVGTPVITWPQDVLKGRITHSLYVTMGMKGLSVDSRDDYAKLAVSIAQNSDMRHTFSKEIEAKSDVLFMNRGVIGEFKDLIRRECRP